jgi:Carboxypeptidase regulatory-like domain
VLLAPLVLLLTAFALRGQSPTGEIRVQIKDPSGAVMVASGRLESLAAGVQRTFQTDAHGTYSLGSLPYGSYRLEISKTGFVPQSVLIDVQSAAPILRVITMALSSPTSKLDVIATTPLAGTDLTSKRELRSTSNTVARSKLPIS